MIPYDMGVNVSFSSQLAGANTDWFFSPIYEGDKIKFRPLAGARYIRLAGSFPFDGYDSGLGYTVANQPLRRWWWDDDDDWNSGRWLPGPLCFDHAIQFTECTDFVLEFFDNL